MKKKKDYMGLDLIFDRSICFIKPLTIMSFLSLSMFLAAYLITKHLF
jgi:hypothetical protein